MAIVGGISTAEIRTRAAPWIADRFGGATVAGVTAPVGNGRSTDTFLVDLDNGERFVLRVEPSAYRVVYEYDLGREALVMDALARNTDIPVPKVLFHEPDPAILGSPFLVLERREGCIPGDEPPFPADPDSWVHSLSDLERTVLADDALRTLAAIHAVDWRALGLGSLDRPELGADALTQHVSWWRAFFDWGSAGRPCSTIEETFDWLAKHWPADPGPTVLSWGDARLGNLMFAGPRVSAVLDWELATLAPAGCDLGWWLFCDRHHSEGVGAPWPPGLPDRDETLSRYTSFSGRTIAHARWFEVYGGLRFAVLMNRAGNMLIEAGALPADHTMAVNNPATQLLARMIGVTAPDGQPTSFLDPAST
ncbi:MULTISPECIES: phosphotransferase family protein [Mycobacterium]|uniref:Phosphotransferase family protein n=1 Tax=Mycobacterium kiyosense TaxID=2871094 RepID=A0A9P3UW73_9MYCO|nr:MULTISPECIES: phosphotransferase family protein [Mycobacterium]BDB44059.1 phosphotransferase family protein [Mycobacterium kiyosense]BDE15595.1 phosphotransferase family protein [Mycobacterium sp. 20KCMC460]GLB80982.1 phosphotransferase family protein [Mycobacterium kiyosense]GLB87258.1 phosphotransferase family protein [Mycobacterium kiyosense]GLB93462.1 phosphotransferase family protein [Mycobacterium kiyosense]